MADSWEDLAEDDVPVAVAEGAYSNGEDEDALESWEDELEEKPKVQAAPIKKKRNLQQIIKEKEEKQEKERLALLERKKEEDEDPISRKKRIEQAQKESDLQVAIDLFAAASVQQPAVKKEPVKQLNFKLDDAQPKTKENFEVFGKQLSEKILSVKPQKMSVYATFLEKFIHEIVEPLDYTDIRKLSSILSTLSNEKQRQEKDKKGKKGTKKAQLKMQASSLDTFESLDGGNQYDPDDDFM